MEVLNNDRLLAVSVTETIKEGKRGSIYECARKWWPVKLDKARKVDYVLAVNKSIVVGVFKPTQWIDSTNPSWPERYEFIGTEVHDSPYLNQYLRMYFGMKYLGEF